MLAYLPHIQWLPKRIQWQWIYLVYRWVIAGYFSGWLVPSGLYPANGGVKFFIFLTNWSFLAFILHLIVSALSSTTKAISVYCCNKSDKDTQTLLEKRSLLMYIDIDKPVGCCGCQLQSDETTWYQKIHWVLFYVGIETALIVSILYFSLIYEGGEIDGVNANTHLINAIVALIDIFISGIPVRVLHFYTTLSFSATYIVFTGIYHAAGGTNVQDDSFIYSVIDYGNNPGSALGWALGVTFGIVPLCHLAVYGLYSIRFWLTYYLWKRLEPQSQPPTGDEELGEIKEENH